MQAVSLIAQGYPRGNKQLIGPFKSLFGPTDAAAWFGSRGVRLKTEGDGRMFPVTDDSQTIIDCLEGGPIMDSCAVLPWRHIIPCGTSTRIQGIRYSSHRT